MAHKGGDVVLIASSPPGQCIHYHFHSWGKTISGGLYRRYPVPSYVNHLIIYTEYPEARTLDSFLETEKVLLLSNWSDVIQALQEFHGANAKVAVYPSADLQYFA